MPKITPLVVVENIPQDLRDLPRWCCWKETPSAGNRKASKPPIDANLPFMGHQVYASPTDPKTWAPFAVALRILEQAPGAAEPASGLSFALSNDGIVGIDLDACRNVKTRKIDDWALEIVKRLATYTEISPSGTGLRMFLRAKLPANGRHKGNVEVYDRGKVLSVTGRQLRHGAGDGIEDRSAELLVWHREIFGNALHSTKENGSNGQVVVHDPPDLDQSRLKSLFQVKPAAKANFEGRHGKPSQSEADLALANYATAAGWTAQQTADLLVMARLNAGEPIKPAGYFQRTIAKARDGKVDLGKHRSAFAADLAKRLPAATARVANTQNRKSAKGGAEGVKAIGIDEARRVLQAPVLARPRRGGPGFVGSRRQSAPQHRSALAFSQGRAWKRQDEALNPLRELSRWTLVVSNLTPAAMISGYVDPNGPDPSLLPQLDGKCLVVKDFTTILAMNPMQRRRNLRHPAGRVRRSRGEKLRHWPARIRQQLQPAGRRHVANRKAWHLSSLGEHFLCWSMAIDHKQQTQRAMTNANHEPGIRNDLATAAAGVASRAAGRNPRSP